MRFAYFRLKALLSGRQLPRRDPRVQDAAAKDALKQAFPLIRVMPGHGDEFLGARLIPRSFLADRDLLMALGYPMDADKSLLVSRDIARKVSEIREEAYSAFVGEMRLWRDMGYSTGEMAGLLVRIYSEQAGGGHLVEEDRRERRERIEETLGRAATDRAGRSDLPALAESTLSMLQDIP